MKTVSLAAAFALFMPMAASAQSVHPCEPRVAIGAAAGLLTVDFPVDPVLAGVGRFGLAKTTGTGLEASGNATLPLSSEWSLNAELGAGAMAVEQQRDATGEYISRRIGDDATVRRLQIGFQHHRGGRGTCAYAGIAAGLYRYSYRGVALNVPGASGMVGIEAPQSGSGRLFLELGVSVALTRLLTPTAAELVANLRPAIGWRYRF